jgi:hypothetical protein
VSTFLIYKIIISILSCDLTAVFPLIVCYQNGMNKVNTDSVVVRRVFGPKRYEVTGEWRKLRNEELNDMYSIPNIVRVVKLRRMRWAGHVARMGEKRVVHRVLVGKPEGKRPLGRPRRRWEDNIKMDVEEVGCRGDWMELAQDRDRWRALVSTVKNLRVP